MSETKKMAGRPLSPHLQVYRLPLTAVMSITHRATGAALAIGTAMLVWMLVAAATGPQAYEAFRAFAGSGIGLLMIFGWSVALFYHLCNGIRHLFWDTGRLFAIQDAYKSGYAVLALTAVLTFIFWSFACPWSH